MKHNLIELLNAFYDLDIPKCIDTSASLLFITLLRKFNSTKNKGNGDYFPDCLPIYNSELCSLTGIDERALRRIRQRLIDFRLVENNDNTWLIRYETHGTHKAGIYSLNYEMLECFDYGHFSNQNVRNVVEINGQPAEIADTLVTKNAELPQKQSPVADTLVTKNAELDDFSSKSVGLSRTKQNKTKQNETEHHVVKSVSITNIGLQNKESSDDSFLDKEFEKFMELDIGMRHKLLESKSLNPEIKKRYIEMQEAKNE